MSAEALPKGPEAQPRSSGLANVPVVAGDVVAGKYVVDRVVGAGGVGVVVSATVLGSEERVAIKLLQRSACNSDENLARFDREGRALAKLDSPNVARVLDVGALDTGEPFLVLELLDGDDLSAVLRREAPIATARAVDWIVQACEAVTLAHARGIVHRDLKPANLFLCRDQDGEELIKVLDFGISKLLRDATPRDHGLTQATSIIGSPLYMSPEQMESPAEADERSDIWALGTLLYELLAGAAPFDAPTVPMLCAEICTGAPLPLRERMPEVPTALAGVVHRCLANRPADRWASVAEFARAIAPFGSARAASASARIVQVARDAGLPVAELAHEVDDDGSGPVSAVRPKSQRLAAGGSGLSSAILDEESSLDGPKSSKRRWSWSSAPPPPPEESSQPEPAESLRGLAAHAFGAAIAACVALAVVWAVTWRTSAPTSASLGVGRAAASAVLAVSASRDGATEPAHRAAARESSHAPGASSAAARR